MTIKKQIGCNILVEWSGGGRLGFQKLGKVDFSKTSSTFKMEVEPWCLLDNCMKKSIVNDRKSLHEGGVDFGWPKA